MSVSLSRVAIDVVLELNAGTPGAYSSTVTDPRWNTTQIVDAILTADGMAVQATIRNSQNARASLYTSTQIGLTTGAQITNSAGPLFVVEFVVTGGSFPGRRPAIPWDLAEIQHEIENTLALSYDPHYTIQNRKIFHNASAIATSESATISVDASFPAYTRSSACQAADEYEFIVYCGAMSMLVSPEGENAGVMGGWAQIFNTGLQMIAVGEGNMSAEFEEAMKRKMAA